MYLIIKYLAVIFQKLGLVSFVTEETFSHNSWPSIWCLIGSLEKVFIFWAWELLESTFFPFSFCWQIAVRCHFIICFLSYSVPIPSKTPLVHLTAANVIAYLQLKFKTTLWKNQRGQGPHSTCSYPLLRYSVV